MQGEANQDRIHGAQTPKRWTPHVRFRIASTRLLLAPFNVMQLDRVFAPSQNIHMRSSPGMQAEVLVGPLVTLRITCVQTNFPSLEAGAQIVLGVVSPGIWTRQARKRRPKKGPGGEKRLRRHGPGILVRGTNQSRQEPLKAENDRNYGPGSPLRLVAQSGNFDIPDFLLFVFELLLFLSSNRIL